MSAASRAASLSLLLAAVLASTLAAAPSDRPREPLSIGVLADADSLPLLVAEAEGLFAAEGVEVRLVRFSTAVERDSALQAEAIDGAITDLVAVALASQAGLDLRATSVTDGRYGIVAAPGSGISAATGLALVPVGISSSTIIQYVAEALLARAGLSGDQIRVVAVPNIQLRTELLLAGQLRAACLPEPLLSVARARGAILLATTSGAGLDAGVLAFRKSSLDLRLDEVAAFYRAYREAAKIINGNNAKYRDFIVDSARFPEEARSSYEFVVYKRPRLPTGAEMKPVLEWMRGKSLASTALDETRLVDGRPLDRAFGGW